MNELYPLIEALAEVHPFSITYEHCASFMKLADQNGDGVLQLDEYCRLGAYVIALSCLQYQQEEAANIGEEEKLRQENGRLQASIEIFFFFGGRRKTKIAKWEIASKDFQVFFFFCSPKCNSMRSRPRPPG